MIEKNLLLESPPKTLWQFFWTFYGSHKVGVLLFCLCSSYVGFYGLFNTYVTKIIIDHIQTYQNTENILQYLLWPSFFLVFNIIVLNMCWRGVGLLKYKIVPQVKNRMIQYLFSYAHRQASQYFEETMSGSIANNINLLADHMERIATILSVRLIKGFVQWGVALLLMFLIHPIFCLGLFLWSLLFSIGSLVCSKKLKLLSQDYARNQSLVSGHIVESVSNAFSVKIFAAEGLESKKLDGFLTPLKYSFQKKEWFLMQFNLLQGLSISALIGFMLYWLIQLRIDNQVTLGDFALILGSSLYVTEAIWALMEQLDEMSESLGRCRQGMQDLLKPLTILEGPFSKPLFIRNGSIDYKNVFFQYQRGPLLFKDLTLSIPSGQKVGIVGCSGAGKSSLIKLLLRLYDINSGEICIDGQNIKEVTQSSLRMHISLIPQDPSLFHRSLFDNIRYGKPTASDEEVIEAAKKASLHECALKLPQGYHTILGERGVKLSGGERQRVAIARAFLKNAPILILDEGTSQLDALTEHSIKISLDHLMDNRTTLVIAHRFSTLLAMDRILVFNDGVIVEDGSHQRLFDQNKMYRTLFEAQTGNTSGATSGTLYQ